MVRRCLFLAVIAACGTTTHEGAREPLPNGEAEVGAPSTDDTLRGAEISETSAPVRVHYDLATHVEDAELFEGEARVLDLGTRGGAKYTAGGWLSGIGSEARVDDALTGVVMGTRGRLHVPVEARGPHRVLLSARALGPGALTLFVGQREVAALSVPTDRFATLSFEVPAGILSPGDNELLLRTPRPRDVPDVGGVGLLLAWMRIAPAGADALDRPPPRPEARLGEHPALAIGERERLGWAFEVPEGARVRGVVVGEGRLALTAHRDGAPPVALARIGRGPFDVDLSGLAGTLIRLDLEARDADLVVGRPTIVTPREREAQESLSPPKHVLVYLIDTLRADKLRPYAPETRVRTPGLDAFARAATTFTRGHSQENWTKPSVATLLSGLMPWQHTAVTGEAVLPRSVHLLPEMLKERGYYTGSFIANGYVSQAFGFHQGWDTYRNYIRENLRTDAEHVAADVLAWLDARPEDQPFLLYVHAIDPHVPYRPPDEYLRMYEETAYRGPLSFRRDATLLEGIKTGRTRTTAADRAHLEALYDGEISYHDVHFAAILDGLARRGLDEETVVVVTADHGEEFWDHGSVGHGHSVYEELLHIPMFMRVPGAPVSRVDAPVGLVDVVPTLLDVLGLPVPDDLAGRSVLPEILERDVSRPAHTVSGFMENWRTVVVGRHKLIQRTTHAPRLYDLEADPDETRDIAADHPIAVRLARGLLGLTLDASDRRPHRARNRRRHVPETIQIDAELEAHLEALGYVH
jgi:arylsulfatase A-like enzyme